MDFEFDIFGDCEQDEPKGKQERDETLVVEALQIVRFRKSTVGTRSREILDVIKVTYPSMTYERALKIAKFKAQKLGNCIVVEKLERIVGNF